MGQKGLLAWFAVFGRHAASSSGYSATSDWAGIERHTGIASRFCKNNDTEQRARMVTRGKDLLTVQAIFWMWL